jgi:hypothetical protein
VSDSAQESPRGARAASFSRIPIAHSSPAFYSFVVASYFVASILRLARFRYRDSSHDGRVSIPFFDSVHRVRQAHFLLAIAEKNIGTLDRLLSHSRLRQPYAQAAYPNAYLSEFWRFHRRPQPTQPIYPLARQCWQTSSASSKITTSIS